MTDDTSQAPEQTTNATTDQLGELRQELVAHQKQTRRLESRLHARNDVSDAAIRLIAGGGAVLASLLMSVGVLMKVFVPVSGDDKSLTLFQVLDPEYDPDLLDSDGSWDTGPGWYIPILMVVVCIVLVVSVGAVSGARPRVLVTVAEVFCWCLAIGCVLGFATLANSRNVVAVPGGLVVILVGAVIAALTCRLTRTQV